jgi:SAM-dependent methyltransferase
VKGKGLPVKQDAYGRAMLDHFEGRLGAVAIIERDDGYIDVDFGMAHYFDPFPKWSRSVRRAMRLVRGRTLDVGAGAGRIALHLQERGHDVVAIDNSPQAIRVCRKRGVKDARIAPFTSIDRKLGTFDSVVMMGNNFGLFGSRDRARWMLRRLKRLTSENARIIGQTLDPYKTDDPMHAAYHRRNRRRGRMSGQIKIRVRYMSVVTPWLDYLFVSVKELREIVDGTGWSLSQTITEDGEPQYIAVLEKL